MKGGVAHVISFSNSVTAWSPWIISGDFELLSNFRNIEVSLNSCIISTWWIWSTLNVLKLLIVIDMEWSSVESLSGSTLFWKVLTVRSVANTSGQVRVNVLNGSISEVHTSGTWGNFFIVISVFTSANQLRNFWTIIIMRHPKFITNTSSPVEVKPHSTIADQNTLQINGWVLSDNLVGNERNVHTTIWLTSNPELVWFEFRESFIKDL